MSDIICVSHVVLGNYFDKKNLKHLKSIGYKKHGSEVVVKNYGGKNDFIYGKMAETSTLTLMKSKSILPPVEIIKENNLNSSLHKLTDESAFIGIVGKNIDDKQLDKIVRKKINHDLKNSIINYTHQKDLLNTLQVIVCCTDPNISTELWKILGISYEIKKKNISIVTFHKTAFGPQLNIWYTKVKNWNYLTWLNQTGIVCLSFFCRDVYKLHSKLQKFGFMVGDFFEISPFNKKLKNFFFT